MCAQSRRGRHLCIFFKPCIARVMHQTCCQWHTEITPSTPDKVSNTHNIERWKRRRTKSFWTSASICTVRVNFCKFLEKRQQSRAQEEFEVSELPEVTSLFWLGLCWLLSLHRPGSCPETSLPCLPEALCRLYGGLVPCWLPCHRLG